MTTATDIALARAGALLLNSRSGIAFTGAGVSVESGIPHFRGEGGLWTKFDPYKVAHIDTFRKDPAQYWTYSLNHRRPDAEPTLFDDLAAAVIHGKAGEVLPEIVSQIGVAK